MSFLIDVAKCRLCQKHKGETEIIVGSDICKRIIQCVHVEVAENHSIILPQSICSICIETIEKFILFQEHCWEIDKQLKEYVNNVQLKTSTNVSVTEESVTTVRTRNKSSHVCSICSKTFSNLSCFNKHQRSHRTKYECDKCKASFNNQKLFKTHNCVAVDNEVKIKTEYNSGDSIVEFDTIQNNNELEGFVKVRNIEELTKKCFDVDKNIKKLATENSKGGSVTQNKKNRNCLLCRHENCEHKLIDAPSEQATRQKLHFAVTYPCSQPNCPKYFIKQSALQKHEQIHFGYRRFLCVSCGKGFITKQTLRCHEKIHKEKKDHVCGLCGKGFSVQTNLTTHIKAHHNGERFYCSQCARTFLTKCSLQRHELVHTGVKEHVCDKCKAAFYTLKELTKHKKYHDGVRSYHCEVCFKSFFEKHHLTAHLRCHTGEKPYKCKHCGKTFRESQKLSRHIRQVHLDKAKN